MLELILFDNNEELIKYWQADFKQDNITIHHMDFWNLSQLIDYDCVVSPANSFGIMDGGIDLSLRNYFGMQLQDKVKDYIFDNFNGEQPVGTSFIIETNYQKHPFVAHTPIMRVPMKINNTDDIYRAMYAMLNAVNNHNKTHVDIIKSVACCGLGASTGKVNPYYVSGMMSTAYHNFTQEPKNFNFNWNVASGIQNSISKWYI
jgi:O-acetyl-ADP-ribose deacetylase (regulator of RNase III)